MLRRPGVARLGVFTRHSAETILRRYSPRMPWGLKRYQQTRQLHFITFSCYGRAPLLGTAHARDTFLSALERVRRWYGFYVVGYVVMPEHVHLLISEPESASLALAPQMTKQMVSTRIARAGRDESLVAAALLIQRLERAQASGEAALPAPESGKAWTGERAGRVGLEQLSRLPFWADRNGSCE